MERKRLLELAIKELERQKAEIAAEIQIARSELDETGKNPTKAKSASAKAGITHSKTKAANKARSQRMKKYWAAKKSGKAKSSAKAKTPPVKAKVRKKTEAEKKALSLKMKEVWKKRKAAAGKKTK